GSHMALSPGAGKITDKIAMLGEGGVGKTSLTVNLTKHVFSETYDPTLEDSYRRQCVIDGIPSHLEILDTAGQEEYGALREQWIRQNELFVIVFDVTRRSSFEAAERLFEEVIQTKRKLDETRRHPGDRHPDDLPFAPSLVVLVGNKCDLDTRREVGTLEGSSLAKKLGCGFVETSAKLGTNVEEAFFSVVRADRRRKREVTDEEQR
uniref:Ras-3 from Cryphonectria parasitica n=1 Tax=Cryphonectria parasitica TaxID=5116 RepID=UPI0003349048|nr:Chain A, Ras-3 from Cryphonectria parasitica [Cryphonectria parasitica]4KU4_B Chain B, Ras-3 from Cryphonectria parasitica [Cryphonectria parasitica]